MAQDGPHDHKDLGSSDDHSFPPSTILTLLGPAENNNGGSRLGSPVGMDAYNKGKHIVPNAIQGGEDEDGSASGGKANTDRSKGKHPHTSEATTETTRDGFPKGEGSLAAENCGDLKAHLVTERERRRRMKDLFSNLHALMPHVPEKVDKASLVGETIHFIRVLEHTKLQLEKRKEEQELAQQAAALAAVSSSSSYPVPQTAQGMAAMSNGMGPVVLQEPLAPAVVRFQTWSAPNVVLSVSNNKAIINLCLPRQPRVLTVVMSVLSKHAIDVITTHVAVDGDQSFITIYALVINRTGSMSPPAEDKYKLAVSEIMVLLSS